MRLLKMIALSVMLCTSGIAAMSKEAQIDRLQRQIATYKKIVADYTKKLKDPNLEESKKTMMQGSVKRKKSMIPRLQKQLKALRGR